VGNLAVDLPADITHRKGCILGCELAPIANTPDQKITAPI
jgi:hypothetical protein